MAFRLPNLCSEDSPPDKLLAMPRAVQGGRTGLRDLPGNTRMPRAVQGGRTGLRDLPGTTRSDRGHRRGVLGGLAWAVLGSMGLPRRGAKAG